MTTPSYIPIDTWRRVCAWCNWVMASHFGPGTGVVEVSHGCCDACLEEHFPRADAVCGQQEKAG